MKGKVSADAETDPRRRETRRTRMQSADGNHVGAAFIRQRRLTHDGQTPSFFARRYGNNPSSSREKAFMISRKVLISKAFMPETGFRFAC
ncbi:MAG: hypothetical protein SOY30_04800 [Eubacteriales bacterium]|nr:hypothetical protein [Eubacteriales bacterium]